jgi:hypothetical protein
MTNMISRLIFPTLILWGSAMSSSNACAHDAFKEPLEKRYGLKTASCKTCHPNNKDRSIHNQFGKHFLEALKGTDITKKFKEAEAQGDEAVKEFEKIMVQEFVKAMEVVEKKKISFEDLIKAGLLNGTRVDNSKDE